MKTYNSPTLVEYGPAAAITASNPGGAVNDVFVAANGDEIPDEGATSQDACAISTPANRDCLSNGGR